MVNKFKLDEKPVNKDEGIDPRSSGQDFNSYKDSEKENSTLNKNRDGSLRFR